MGMSVKGQLSYGFKVGFIEERCGFAYDDPAMPPWLREEDAIGEAERLLLASVGFTETWHEGNDGYFARRKDAEQRLGVSFELFGYGDYAGYLLVAEHRQSGQGVPLDIDPATLTVPDGTDEQLLRAAAVLRIERRPRWILTGLYF